MRAAAAVGVAAVHDHRAREVEPVPASWRPGMPISVAKFDATAVDVTVMDDRLVVILADGRELSAPLAWFPRLLDATPEQRRNWRFIGRGRGIHWPDVDEDISTASLLKAG
jgi:hypothetical protein